MKTRLSLLGSISLGIGALVACGSPPGPTPPASGTIVFEKVAGGQEGDIFTVHTDGSELQRLAEGPGAWLEHPSPSPDGTRIVYHSGFSGGLNTFTLWTIGSDGSNQVQLTRRPLSALWPAWSPDGAQIVFSLYVPETDTFDIQILSADGHDISPLTSGDPDDLFPTWTSSGGILFLRAQEYESPSGADVFVVNPDGSGLEQLTTMGHVGGYAVSPDGTEIAVHDAESHRIVLLPMGGTDPPLTLTDTDFGCLFVALGWSPDGQALCIGCSDFGNAEGSEIHIVRADGSGLMTVPNTEGALDPAWAPG